MVASVRGDGTRRAAYKLAEETLSGSRLAGAAVCAWYKLCSAVVALITSDFRFDRFSFVAVTRTSIITAKIEDA